MVQARRARRRWAPILFLSGLLGLSALPGAAALPDGVAADDPRAVARAVVAAALPPVTVPAWPDCREAPPVALRLSGDVERGKMAGLKAGIAAAVAEGRCRLVLDLDSGGGRLPEAMNLAWFLRALPAGVEVTTRVGPGARCHSACTLVFAAGRVRRAAADARFFFHPVSVSIRNPDLADLAPGIAREMTRYWLEEIRSADPNLARILGRFGAFRRDGRSVVLTAAATAARGWPWVGQVEPAPTS
ncbi:MAG TPA: hypothetical protein VED40_09965 [Azospirillaceae bacterium]|nr:hypothetical protein [Azospirillaceae bacterium]